MRARMAIYIAGIDVEKIEVSLKNKPQSLLDYSPKATVPVVVTPTGEVIEQSRDIMNWALLQADPDNWLLQNDILMQQQMKQLIDSCDNEFKPLLDRYKYFDRYPEYSQLEYRQQAENFIQVLETRLKQQAFLVDSQMRLADAAIFPFTRQFAAVDHDWFMQSDYTNLQRWIDVCVNTTMFKSIMEKS
ncbi:glutathione S-transferase [Cellvibrio zantedeschiae]|uniref:Glutathione S-transferase n=2 Tax=Cellvibrio zantedeschiae TaxID=1237077 RepID=A0ABQ3B142_9GAMM|nr:glutathione S-transferase [Cellvibrio zantedeschiae]